MFLSVGTVRHPLQISCVVCVNDFQNNVNEATKIKVSEELNHILENMIIKKPNQWILTHNRWK